MTKREQYFSDFYRIWGVKKTIKAKAAYWIKYSPYYMKGKGLTDRELVKDSERLHLEVKVPTAPKIFPSGREIFTEKWYWEHGVVSDQDGRLRFFTATFPEVLEHNNLDGMTPEQKLSWWEEFQIIYGNELLIDPNTQFC